MYDAEVGKRLFHYQAPALQKAYYWHADPRPSRELDAGSWCCTCPINIQRVATLATDCGEVMAKVYYDYCVGVVGVCFGGGESRGDCGGGEGGRYAGECDLHWIVMDST